MVLHAECMPNIRIEVEGLKTSIVHHLGVAGSELGEYIAEHIQQAVDEYPWESTVKRHVDAAIQSAIEKYFKYGAGAVAIQEAVEQALMEKEP